MESKPTDVENLFEKLKDYADVRMDLFKLKAINKVSGFISSFFTRIIMIAIFCVVFLCVTIGLALWIGDFTGKAFYGFFIVAGGYLIIGLVLYSLRGKLIKNRISDKLIKEMID